MTRKKRHPAEGLLAHCPWHSIRLETKASRPETNGTISWQRQASRASCTTIADAMSKTEVAAVKGSALQSQTQHAAMNDAARCDGQRTALQHRTQNSGLGRGVPIVAPNIRFAICQNRPSFAHAMPPSPPADATRDIGHDLSGCAATLCLFRLKPHLQHTLLSGHPRPSDFMAEDAPMPIHGQTFAHNTIMYRG